MRKNLGKTILSLALCATTVSCVAGCNQNQVPDTEETLSIYVLDAGYKTDWVHSVIELFQQQDWVKEKYPNLVIPYPNINDVESYAQTRLDAGSRNELDLMFMANLPYSYKGAANKVVDLTDVLYNSTVPGEDILYKDKMASSFLRSMAYNNPTQEYENGRYYSTTWAGGEMSILYNETILNSLGIAVPNTTDELIAACEAIRLLKGNTEGKYNHGYSFVASKDAIYWDYLYAVWWSQYEGMESYYNFFNGIDGNRLSKNIFKQKGRLEGIKVYEDILGYDTGYLDPAWADSEFMTTQTQFLQGYGVFHVNGDWWPSEMAEMEARIPEEKKQSIKIMPLPIVSSIIEKTPTIPDDATLSKVVEAIDNEVGSYPGVSAEDYNKVKAARSIVYSFSANIEAIIPFNANGKDVAIDFLRFMATDAACAAYIKATDGASLPFAYDVETKNPELFNSISPFHQERLRQFNLKSNPITYMPYHQIFPLAVYGGVGAFTSASYFATFSRYGNTKTAQKYYDSTLEAWTDEKWDSALRNAGLK